MSVLVTSKKWVRHRLEPRTPRAEHRGTRLTKREHTKGKLVNKLVRLMLLGKPLLPCCTCSPLCGASPPSCISPIPEHMPPLHPSPRRGGYVGGENRHEQIWIRWTRRVLELEPARPNVPRRTMLPIGHYHTAYHLDDVVIVHFFCNVSVCGYVVVDE